MFDPFLNCVYAVVITMTTVGFGDMVPWTPFGKIISIFNALFGGFVVTLTIVKLGGIFDFNIQQRKAFYNLIVMR